MLFSIRFFPIIALVFLSLAGCNRLGDPKTIVVAEVDGEKITRGDLGTLLSGMDDTERPQIRTRRDFVRFLNSHIDTRLKLEAGEKLAEEGIGFITKEQVIPSVISMLSAQMEGREPMLRAVWAAGQANNGTLAALPEFEVSAEEAQQTYNQMITSADMLFKQQEQGAAEQFFTRMGDSQEIYRFAWSAEIPEGDQMTPLMEVYDLTPDRLRSMKALIQENIDEQMRLNQGDRALIYLAQKALESGTIKLDPEDLKREYEIQKDSLTKFEQVEFKAIRFPDSDPEAAAEASLVKERIANGETFDAILQEYLANDPGRVMQSAIENDPASERFAGLWVELSGTEIGQIVGPVYVPEYQQVAMDTNNQQSNVIVPASYLVLQVVSRRDAGPLTLEEAQAQLAPPIVIAEMVEQLRKEHNVVIYEDKLPDPRDSGGGANPYVS